MQVVRKIICFTLPLALAGCTNDSSDDLTEDMIIPGTPVTYSRDVAPIIAANCLGCHTNPPQNGAPIPLTAYAFVKTAVQQHGLIDRISREQGAEGMMPNGGIRLPQNTIEVIKQWEQQGFQE